MCHLDKCMCGMDRLIYGWMNGWKDGWIDG